ncbi:MAG: endolytic transglycosylase MltG [Candidatus Paceibacterota bacterium]|jgi:UPF0755 protein
MFKIKTNFPNPEDNKDKKQKIVNLGLYTLCVFAVVFILFNLMFVFPPYIFPTEIYFQVENGQTASDVAENLYQQGLILSPKTFKAFIFLLGGQKKIQTGSYYFNQPISVLTIALRLTNCLLGHEPYRITFFEGASVSKIAKAISLKIPNFEEESFIKLGTKWEGYLFPDTYFFSRLDGPNDMIKAMRNNFDNRIKTLEKDIQATEKTMDEIIIMASIIDREVKTEKDRRLVSGILWKRIATGMPLQVDATFEYYLGKTTFDLTKDDLKSKSPYNTYINKGLPPTPIGNPGWDAILAAIQPEESDYWFYLSDHDGIMHYAETFDEHKLNRKKYNI